MRFLTLPCAVLAGCAAPPKAIPVFGTGASTKVQLQCVAYSRSSDGSVEKTSGTSFNMTFEVKNGDVSDVAFSDNWWTGGEDRRQPRWTGTRSENGYAFKRPRLGDLAQGYLNLSESSDRHFRMDYSLDVIIVRSDGVAELVDSGEGDCRSA